MLIEIFIITILAMIATGFWEAYMEGAHPWAEQQVGWTIQITKSYSLTAYHFFAFWIMFPLLLIVFPMVLLGFSWQLLGITISAFSVGLLVEDFTWFLVNPKFPLRNFNSANVKWYSWLKLGKFEIPLGYVIGIVISIASWFFLWRP
ncbi:hypothetical protein C4573_04360 [Candidatus Woesearchaeota archaeon]|nr:MAG: hypothetical protein C4573_04360 [Candidatus Woesearchaeota archaeon]